MRPQSTPSTFGSTYGPPLPDDLKQCTRCCTAQPLEAFSRDQKQKSGLKSHCKDCMNAQGRAWRARYPERAKEAYRRWRAQHPEHVHAWNTRPELTQYRAAHREERRAAERNRYRAFSAEDRARQRAMQGAWLEANREHVKARVAKWRELNYDKVLLAEQRRTQRYATAAGRFSRADIRALYSAQEGCCAYCGSVLLDRYEIEHRLPLVRGGSNWPDNLALSCASCNRRKGTKTDKEFCATLKETTL